MTIKLTVDLFELVVCKLCLQFKNSPNCIKFLSKPLTANSIRRAGHKKKGTLLTFRIGLNFRFSLHAFAVREEQSLGARVPELTQSSPSGHGGVKGGLQPQLFIRLASWQPKFAARLKCHFHGCWHTWVGLRFCLWPPNFRFLFAIGEILWIFLSIQKARNGRNLRAQSGKLSQRRANLYGCLSVSVCVC